MAWVRVHDGAMGSLKIVRLSNSAFRLWIKGLCYCQLNLTDGLIPREAMAALEAKRADVDQLCKVLVEGKSPVWERIDGFGFKVHDYLDYNDSKEEVEDKRAGAKGRAAASRARAAEREAERAALVTAHVTPHVTRTFPLVRLSSQALEEKEKDAREQLTDRAGRFLERYAALFYEHRRGARYHARPALDFPKACEVVQTWADDARLEKLAVLVLTTDDDWIARTDRGFAVFAARASWADDRLRAWETEHGVSA